MRQLAALFVALMLAVPVIAGEPALPEVPDDPSTELRYVFYLHGRIIEDAGPRPTHPVWGVYEYQQILDQLSQEGALVISEVRASGTDVDVYADKVAAQVEKLLAAGVPEGRITVVGFSKGSGIARRVSQRVDRPEVRYVLLASCAPGLRADSSAPLHGRMLSIYEATDQIGQSCAVLFGASPSLTAHDEVRIDLGSGHGAFYQPHEAWLKPVLAWIGAEVG